MEIATNAQSSLEKTVRDLREQLDQDVKLLAYLPSGSATYDLLTARVEQMTEQLLAYEHRLDRQRRADELAAQRRLQQQSRNEVRLGGLVMLALGAIVTYAGWGTWWLVLSVLLLASGLLALFGDDV